jgi:hypothetical protein
MAGHSRPKDGVASARLCPGHPRLTCEKEDVDTRDKRGHDEQGCRVTLQRKNKQKIYSRAAHSTKLQEGFQPIPANDILEQIEDVSIYFRQPTSSAIASD